MPAETGCLFEDWPLEPEPAESRPEQAVVDGGYVNQQNLIEAATKGVESIGPVPDAQAKAAQCYARAGVKEAFYADRFRFEPVENCCYCPPRRGE